MVKVHLLNDIQPAHREEIGVSIAWLGQLIDNGCPVLPSLVVPVQAFQEFLSQVNWLEPLFADLPNSSLYLDVNNPRQLQAIAHQIRMEILAAPPPLDLAEKIVAACQSWQSLALVLRPHIVIPQQSFLGLRASELLHPQLSWNSVDDLAQGLRATWAELFRAKSLFHWQRSGIQLHQLGMAILVQPLPSVLASGTLQSQGNQVIINAFCGMVLPSIKPVLTADVYRIHRDTGELWQQTTGKKWIACDLAGPFPSVGEQVSVNGAEQTLPVQTHAALHCYILNRHYQQAPVLSPEQVRSLQGLVQQTQALEATSLSLDWLLLTHDTPPSDSASSQAIISQVYHGSDLKPAPSMIRLGQDTIGDMAPSPGQAVNSGQHRPDSSHDSSQDSSDDGASVASPVLTGLAASPGEVIGAVCVFSSLPDQSLSLAAGSIVVATTVGPDWLPLLEQAAGIITEQGGLTSHAAILARDLGIPAIVNVANAMATLQAVPMVRLNGTTGHIYPQLSSGLGLHPSVTSSPSSPLQPGPLGTSSVLRTQLLVNLNQRRSLKTIAQLPVNGVGLVRSELILLEALDYNHPHRWLASKRQKLVDRMADTIREIVAAFAPRPVWYRSLDLRSHEFRGLPGGAYAPIETNPALGLRGTLSYVKDPVLFDLELQALARVQQSGYSNLHLLLPFVRTVEEFIACRQRVMAAGLIPDTSLQLWIMAEVPSVVWLLPAYAQAGVQGISIGTNDLTQLLLAVDRDTDLAGGEYEATHPAVMAAMAQLIQQAHQVGIPCSICGQAPSNHPALVTSLVNWGITSISVEASAVAQTYEAILQAEQAQTLGIAE